MWGRYNTRKIDTNIYKYSFKFSSYVHHLVANFVFVRVGSYRGVIVFYATTNKADERGESTFHGHENQKNELKDTKMFYTTKGWERIMSWL